MRYPFGKLLLAFVLASAPAAAQPVHFRFDSPGVGYNAFGAYIGTYTGTQNFGTVFSKQIGLNCVDYFHEVMLGQQWDANITSLASDDFHYTRHPESLDKYRQAAWLISNYTPSNVQATQATIWNLFGTPGANWQSDPALLAAAQDSYDEISWRDFYVVTDVRAGGAYDASSVQEFVVWDPQLARSQEFAVTTPEPSTFILMGSGLAGLAMFRSRRKKQA